VRRSLFARLLATICGVAAVATALVLVFQERSLAHGLERAALERLERATRAAERLVTTHLDATSERYATVAATPQVRATLELGDGPTAEHLAGELRSRLGAARIVLLDAAGRTVAGAGPSALDGAVGGLSGAGLLVHEGQPFAATRVPVTQGGATLGSLVAIEALGPALLADWSALCGAEVVVEPAAADVEHELVRTVRPMGPLALRVRSDLSAEHAAVAAARWQLALAGLLALFVAFAASLHLSRGLVRPIVELKNAAERVGRGDLTVCIEAQGPDEIRAVALAFAGMAQSLRETLGRVAMAADRVESAAGRMRGISGGLTEVVGQQTRGQAQALASMARVDAEVSGIQESSAESAEALDLAVDGSSRTFRELEQTGAELGRTADELQEETDEIGSAIDQMSRTGAEISRQTEALLPAVDQTAASMKGMAKVARKIATGAKEAASLSREVVETATRGRDHVQKTVTGMEDIRVATDEAQRAVHDLGSGVKEIGAFLTEIDEVADETELLALNASIIAAQAGEHGRAFAVVADQMKELADRVMNGTKQIYGLVHALQTGMSRAVGAIEKGAARVQSGVERAGLAGRSLEEITDAAERTGERMAAIAVATADQTRSTGEVTTAMEQVRTAVESIRVAGREQAHGNELVQRSAESLRDVAGRVHVSISRQNQGTARIGGSIETVHHSVIRIQQALRAQLDACRDASRLLEGLHEHTRATETAASEMSQNTEGLAREAEDLRADVRRFVV